MNQRRVRSSRQLPLASIVLTAHNEGREVERTIRSVRKNTSCAHEIILVDDASTDGSCDRLNVEGVRILRHQRRVGVAYSRREASLKARGAAFVYLDAHQRVSEGCIDQCVRVALDRQAVVCPEIQDFRDARSAHGATFRLCPKAGYFSARWKLTKPRQKVSPISSLRSPCYVIPRDLYPKVGWSRFLRGWGGSEAAVSIKAFFTSTPILHLRGAIAKHKFRKRFPYRTTFDEIWRNHAILAKICFEDRTWKRHWFPELFRPHLGTVVLRELASKRMAAEHDDFRNYKVRDDRDFFVDLLGTTPPPTLPKSRHASGDLAPGRELRIET